jgi:hypothetical protein
MEKCTAFCPQHADVVPRMNNKKTICPAVRSDEWSEDGEQAVSGGFLLDEYFINIYHMQRY